jgi:hypothetical protein
MIAVTAVSNTASRTTRHAGKREKYKLRGGGYPRQRQPRGIP